MPFDGGLIEYRVDGPEDAPQLLLLHGGTPTAAVRYDGLVRAAAEAGMRTASYSRAGYGRSTRWPGRTIADEAAVSAALADRLGHDRFFTVGWSGCGPVALACAALLSNRVRAAVTLAGVAPRVEAGSASDAWYSDEAGSGGAAKPSTALARNVSIRLADPRRVAYRRIAGRGRP